jgi:hypothetical protein
VALLCCQLISPQDQSASRKVESNDGIGPNSEWTNKSGPDTLGASFGDITISSHAPSSPSFSPGMGSWGDWGALLGVRCAIVILQLL